MVSSVKTFMRAKCSLNRKNMSHLLLVQEKLTQKTYRELFNYFSHILQYSKFLVDKRLNLIAV